MDGMTDLHVCLLLGLLVLLFVLVGMAMGALVWLVAHVSLAFALCGGGLAGIAALGMWLWLR